MEHGLESGELVSPEGSESRSDPVAVLEVFEDIGNHINCVGEEPNEHEANLRRSRLAMALPFKEAQRKALHLTDQEIADVVKTCTIGAAQKNEDGQPMLD